MNTRLQRQRSAALLTLIGVGAACCAPVGARSLPADLAGCAAVTADRERLACYDRASGRPAAPALDTAPASAPMTAPSAPLTAGSTRTATPAPPSMIDNAWGFNPDSSRYTIVFHRPNYLQVARYSSQPNNTPFKQLFDAAQAPDAELDATEARFQISFKARLWSTEDRRFGLWAAYTQQSQWQVYNGELSRPFRENNYMPELIGSFRPAIAFWGWRWQLFNFGYTHQSNGRADPISRSWDRLIAEFGVERDNLALLLRTWYRLPEENQDDDNPDIEDYVGYGDLTAVYKWRGHSFAFTGRGNLDTGKGAAQFSWTSPPLFGPLRGYLQAFTGYGDSMIDYNWNQNSVGIGIALNDLLDGPQPQE